MKGKARVPERPGKTSENFGVMKLFKLTFKIFFIKITIEI